MFNSGEIISYLDMCKEEGVNLQRGMNFRLRNSFSVILMSLRPGALYADRVEDGGKILIYEGHDLPQTKGTPDPKTVDQPMHNPGGTFTQNGLFYDAANQYKKGRKDPELVRVYEKIRSGIWAYNGLFRLVDAWRESSKTREVFKFKLEMIEDTTGQEVATSTLEHNRVIPTSVKLEVWKRDKGRCIQCGSTDNLHFDHIIPYTRGGSSLVSDVYSGQSGQ